MGADRLATGPAVLDEPREHEGAVPEQPGPAGHPLITPSGSSRTTIFESPASWTTRTTSRLGL